MTDWSRLAKLAGMLGSPHDGERLNAARLLEAALAREGVTFGDLSKRISDGIGGSVQSPPRVVYVDREVIRRVYVNTTDNPACEIAHKILAAPNHPRPPTSDWKFLRYIAVTNDLTQGQFALTPEQSNRLLALQETFLTPKPKVYKPKGKPKPVPDDLLDAMGLTEKAEREKDIDEAVGAFRARASGERAQEQPRGKPRPQGAGNAPGADYRGDFKRDPVDDKDFTDDPPF